MDVINKLYSTVSSTVSQLSSVLPGNPVTREFEAISHVASAGPGLQWKVYRGFKKSTKQDASIFVLEKRQLERWPRGEREAVLEALRRGAVQLTKLRHPQILTVQHPLEESRESLAFATEPVFASLANILGATENMPSPLPPQLHKYKLFEVEIKYGLLQIGEGLAFLHHDVRLLHHNVCPEAVVVNQQGAWKLFGFDFCQHAQSSQEAEPYWPFVEYSPAVPALAQPRLAFLAPEYALTMSHSPASDIFSLGALIHCVFSEGRLLHDCDGDWAAFKRRACELKTGVPSRELQAVAEGLRECVKMMLNATPDLRPDAHQFIKVEYFEDVGVKTLNYLDSLFQWDNLQKSQFYKGLPQVLQNLPHRVCVFRVLPCLVKEFVNPTMVPFVLPNVLLVAENCSKEEFTAHVLPHLKPVMKLQEPIQVLLIFMQKMELLLKLTPAADIRTDVLPMLYRALDSDAQQIHELCLSVLPTFAGLVDYPAMKNSLLPRIKRLCKETSYISVRVNCLVCLGKLLEHLDKWLVLDEVLPFLPQIPSREPAVLMGILGIYKLALTHKKLGITKEVMATKVLPFLMPLSIENGLTLNQFNALMALIKDMVGRVEADHRAKLQQLNSIQQESRTVAMPAVPSHLLVAAPQPESEMDQMFSGLGLDGFIGNGVSPTAPGPPPGAVAASAPASGTLSMQEKQRLVRQQEAQRRLTSQPTPSPVTPVSPVTPASRAPPRDLTSSLIETQLSQMKLSPRPPPPTWGAAPSPAAWQPAQGFRAFQQAPQPRWGAPRPSYGPLDALLPAPAEVATGPRQPLLPAKPLSASEIKDLLS